MSSKNNKELMNKIKKGRGSCSYDSFMSKDVNMSLISFKKNEIHKENVSKYSNIDSRVRFKLLNKKYNWKSNFNDIIGDNTQGMI
jgi:hypothetical protein